MRSKRVAISKSKTSEKATTIHSEPSYSAPPPAPFGLMGYASSPNQMAIPIPSPQAPLDSRKPVTVNTTSNIRYHNQCCYPIFPMYPPNAVIPFVHWPQPNTFASFPYPSSYGYMAPGTCISVQPYCSYYNPPISETLGTDEKHNGALDEAKRESNSSSSSTDPREK